MDDPKGNPNRGAYPMAISSAADEHQHADRAAGITILAGLVLSLAFVAYHPMVRSRTRAEFVAEVTAKAVTNGVVHGSLIALAGVLVAGYSGMAYRLGLASI